MLRLCTAIDRVPHLTLFRGLASLEVYPLPAISLLFASLYIVLSVRWMVACFGGRYYDQYWSLIGAVLLAHSYQYWLAR